MAAAAVAVGGTVGAGVRTDMFSGQRTASGACRAAPARPQRLSRAPEPGSAALDAACRALRVKKTVSQALILHASAARLHVRAALSAPSHERR